MKKSVVFWVVLALALAAIANIPMNRIADSSVRVNKIAQVQPANNLPDEIVIPVQMHGAADLADLRGGRNPFDVTDSSMFIDSMEG